MPELLDIQPVFAYGTMRVGGGNDWFLPCATRQSLGATAKGQLYVTHGAFPYCDFTVDVPVIGDVSWCDTSAPLFHQMWRMEAGAGYTPALVDVTLADGELVQALAWHSPIAARTGNRIYGGPPVLIPSGDWFKYNRPERVRVK